MKTVDCKSLEITIKQDMEHFSICDLVDVKEERKMYWRGYLQALIEYTEIDMPDFLHLRGLLLDSR